MLFKLGTIKYQAIRIKFFLFRKSVTYFFTFFKRNAPNRMQKKFFIRWRIFCFLINAFFQIFSQKYQKPDSRKMSLFLLWLVFWLTRVDLLRINFNPIFIWNTFYCQKFELKYFHYPINRCEWNYKEI